MRPQKQIVELHGGSIVAESEGEGRGSTFRVRLPIGSERAGHGGGIADTEECKRIADLTAERLKKLRVLVVDDDDDARELVARILQECGAEVIGVASATAALQKLATQRIDILVCDIGMPGMDGYSLIQLIRQLSDPRVSRLPAIALTAFARPEDRAHALRSGYQAHLVKPVEPAELLATVGSFADLVASQEQPESQ